MRSKPTCCCRIGKTTLPAIKVLFLRRISRPVSPKYMLPCISHLAKYATPSHAALLLSIIMTMHACAIVVSDGTVALRNASQHHTIYYRVQPSKECPNFFSGLMPPPRGTGFVLKQSRRCVALRRARRNPLTPSIYPCAQRFALQDGLSLVRKACTLSI